MPAIIPALSIDADEAVSRYFLPYQISWIADDSRMRLAEKSVRIGWTYADAFKNVRKRLHHKGRDYLFATKDQASAIEYVETCYKFCEIFNLTKTILSHGVDALRVPIIQGGKDTGFTEEVKVGYIKFDTGSRILAFSSNPNAMRVYGGDVGLDEFAYHPAPDELWETAQGRITWGFDLGMWSAHNGTDTLFYVFAQEARLGAGNWSYYRVTMEDACDAGLLAKINEVSGKSWSKEEFLQDCRNRARLPEIYEQAYNCNPRGSTSTIVPWQTIELCQRDYSIPRVHLESHQVIETFGAFSPQRKVSRGEQIQNFLATTFDELISTPARYRLGFDVAASGQGDLASIYIDRLLGDAAHLAGLFTCRTDDWDFLRNAVWLFMRHLPDVIGAGDETGLGRQICWETEQEFPGAFHPINFKSDKHDMGFVLMNQLASAAKQWPKGEKDIASDYFALRKLFQGGRWIFTEGPNLLNPASHCDIAWSGALASKAAAQQLPAPGTFHDFRQSADSSGTRRQTRRASRACLG